MVVYHRTTAQLRPGVAVIKEASQESRRTASSSIEQAPAEASHTETASHGMEISTGGRCVTALCCKLKLMQAAAGGELQSRKPCWTVVALLGRPDEPRPQSKTWQRTEQNRNPAPTWSAPQPPVGPAWGEPKRARPSVPTQPPTWTLSSLLLVVPAFLRPSKTGRQGGVTPGAVLILLWYYQLTVQV